MSGLLYRANIFYIQSWLRIPNFISRLCSNYVLPLVQSRAPDEGAVPMGATLEIQQQQRMEVLEQQMLLSQARQFSRQRNRAVRFGRPVSELHGDSSIFRRVIIPDGVFIPKGFILKGYSSEVFYLERSLFRRFLSGRVINLKVFIPKGHYSEDFYLKVSLFWISE